MIKADNVELDEVSVYQGEGEGEGSVSIRKELGA